ncbi:hypothetical protein D3C87_1999240 [compost metagenome]
MAARIDLGAQAGIERGHLAGGIGETRGQRLAGDVDDHPVGLGMLDGQLLAATAKEQAQGCLGGGGIGDRHGRYMGERWRRREEP